MQATRCTVAARLDRLPIFSFYRRIVWIVGTIFFFEVADVNTFSFAAPAIMKDWNLSISSISFIVSATFIGMFFGGIAGGWYSDRVGRKKALITTTIWYSGFSLLNAAVQGTTGLFVTRLLTGVGVAAMTVIGMTYVSEIFPVNQRGRYQGWIMMFALTGIPITAYVARFTIPIANWGWRLVFIWGALGMAILFFTHLLEESPRWLENRGNYAEADAILDRLEAKARAEFGELKPLPDVTEQLPPRGGYKDLFKAGNLSRTVLMMAVWIGQTMGFYGFTAWVPTLLVAHGFSLVHSLSWSSAMSIGAIPGAFLAAIIAERWERKWSISVVAVTITCCGLIYGTASSAGTIVVFGFLVVMFIQTFAPLLFAYSGECFPTYIRNSGTGLCYGIGRLSNVLGPLIIAYLYNHVGYKSVFAYIAGMWLLVAVVLSAFGPRTKGRILV